MLAYALFVDLLAAQILVPFFLLPSWCIWLRKDLSVGTSCNWSYWLQRQWRYKFSVHGVCPYSFNIEISLWIICSMNEEQWRGNISLLQCLYCFLLSFIIWIISLSHCFCRFTVSGRIVGNVGGESCFLKDGGPSNVKVELLSPAGDVVSSALSTPRGIYSFTNIIPGM